MCILVKLSLIFVVILHGDFLTGSRMVGAAVNRTKEINLLVTATRKLLNATASQGQLDEMKMNLPRCAAKNLTIIRSIFRGSLLDFAGSILGRRKRDVASDEQRNPLSTQNDAGKEPQTRAQDISAIIATATKIFNKLPSDRLVVARKVAQGVAGNFFIRGPFLFAVVGSITACANWISSG